MGIVRPDQNSGGGGGGGGIASWGKSTQATFVGAGSPSGVVAPNAAGDLYVDNSTPGLYQANGVTSTSWQLIGLESGTSFPGSPADGNWFWRTDRSILYFWKNSVSRWLTVDLKYVPVSQQSALNGGTAAPNTLGYSPIFEDIYIEKWSVVTFVSTTNNGSNFYAITNNKITAANVATAVTSFDTSADTAGQWTNHTIAVNALILVSGFQLLQTMLASKTGAPGAIFLTSMYTVRSAG